MSKYYLDTYIQTYDNNCGCGDKNIECNISSDSSYSSSSNPYSSDSSSSNPYSSDSSSDCSSKSSSDCSSSTSSSNPYSSDSSSSCCGSTSSSDSYRSDSSSGCSSRKCEECCFVSGDGKDFTGNADNSPDVVPLPPRDCEESCSSESSYKTETSYNSYETESERSFKTRSTCGDSVREIKHNYECIKIMIKGRIGKESSIRLDDKTEYKMVRGGYNVLKSGMGYIIMYIKRIGVNIDYQYYVTQSNNSVQMIYVEDKYFEKIIEEEMDIKKYLETYGKGKYREIMGEIIVYEKRNIMEQIGKMKMDDIIFYGSQAYMLYNVLRMGKKK